ncbi:MAG: hypothetical protein PHR35_14680 [Kiritimatiellae bacterium]|nr:hypothetical protein [Kiritimatiellia bacterium]
MTVVISNGQTTLNTAGGFYRVEADNLSWFNGSQALTSTRYIAFTAANAGNCQGVVISLVDIGLNISKSVTVTLQEFSGGAWGDVAGATKTLTAAEICGAYMTGSYAGYGQYIVPFVLGVPHAITVTPATWRFKVEQAAGGVATNWYMYTSDVGNLYPFFAMWCDTAVSFNNDDILICKDKVTIDKTTSFGAKLGTSDAGNGVGCVICSNGVHAEANDVALLEWANPPAASYTLTVKGLMVMPQFAGFRVGSKRTAAVTISHAAPGVVTKLLHGLVANQMISFTTTGALPAPLSPTRGVYYYVKTVLDPDTFTISAAPGGPAIDTTTDGSGVHTMEWGRIPFAQRAIVDWVAPMVGTVLPGIFGRSTSINTSYGGESVFVNGQIPRYSKTTLSIDANTGQKNLVCVDAVDWINGDRVVIGKQNVKGGGETTEYTVDSVAGNTVTLTSNLLTYLRRAGATVLRLDHSGVKFSRNGGGNQYVLTPCFFELTGADFYNQIFITFGGSIYKHAAILSTARAQLLVQDCVAWVNSTAYFYLVSGSVLHDGMLVERLYGHRICGLTAMVPAGIRGFAAGRLTHKDCVYVSYYCNGSWLSVSASILLTSQGCSYENASNSAAVHFLSFTGVNSVFKDNYFWGSGNTEDNLGAVIVGALTNPLEISNNHFDNNTCALVFGAYTSVKAIDEGSAFGSEYANTTDIGFAIGCFPDYVFNAPDGSLVISEVNVGEMIVGGRVGFVDFDGVATDDRDIYTLAKIQRTNASLPDSTVRTAGGSAMRIEPTSADSRFEFTYDVPTGDLTGHTMAMAIWCKINSAVYWGGTTFEMPRLTVNYDNGTVIYSEATAMTGWQLLAVYFTPMTSTGKIVVTQSSLTDALLTDAYVYWDDAAVMYPAGETLNLGGLDIWDNALPVLPPIATVMSAMEAWSVLSTISFGGNTMGELVKLLAANAVAIKGKTDLLAFSGSNVQARVNDKGVLNDLSSVDAQAAAAAALGAFGAATSGDVASVPAATAALVPNDAAIQGDAAAAISAAGLATGGDVAAVPAATAALVPTDVTIQADAAAALAAYGPTVPGDLSGLATALALATTDGKVDAIKGKTDLLAFSGSNVQARVNDKGVLNDLSAAGAQAADEAALVTHGAAKASDVTASQGVITAAVAAVPAATEAVVALAHGTGAYDGLTPPQTLRQAMALALTPGTVVAEGSLDKYLEVIEAIQAGRNDIVGSQLIYYARDGVTVLVRFNLYDKDGHLCTFPSARALDDVFRREPVP